MKRRIFAALLAAVMLASVLSSCSFDISGLFEGLFGNSEEGENSVFSKGRTDEGFLKGVTASDYVILPEYKGITAPAAAYEADKVGVKYILEYYVLPYMDFEYKAVAPRPIEDGDTVNIDYTGYVDGVAFDGGSTEGEGTVVTIGVTSYIDGFLPQLIGHEPGESFDINVTFPADYHAADLAGKNAVFSITVNSILEAEITDEMAREFDDYFNSAEELMKDIETSVIQNTRDEFIYDLVDEGRFLGIPETVKTYYQDYYINLYIMNYGDDINGDREGFISYYDRAIDFTMRHDLMMLAIAELEGLRVSDELISELGYDEDVEPYGRPFIAYHLLCTKVVPDFIFDRAVRGEG